jgi:hypothetical protein
MRRHGAAISICVRIADIVEGVGVGGRQQASQKYEAPAPTRPPTPFFVRDLRGVKNQSKHTSGVVA